jgi:hypothetical protein
VSGQLVEKPIILSSWKLSKLQRRALADAYVCRAGKGLQRSVAGWSMPGGRGFDCYSAATIHSLVNRGMLQFSVKGTVAHVTDHGAHVHEELRDAGQ